MSIFRMITRCISFSLLLGRFALAFNSQRCYWNFFLPFLCHQEIYFPLHLFIAATSFNCFYFSFSTIVCFCLQRQHSIKYYLCKRTRQMRPDTKKNPPMKHFIVTTIRKHQTTRYIFSYLRMRKCMRFP